MKIVLPLVLLVALAMVAYFYFFNSPAPSTTTINVNTAPAPSPAPGEKVVTLDEATLTKQLNGALSGQPLGDTPLGPAMARDLSAELRNGQMRVTGQAQAGGASVPVAITCGITAQADRPVVAVQDARLSGVPLPDGAKQQLERAIQAQVDQLVAQNGVRVRSVTVGDGKLTLVGTAS